MINRRTFLTGSLTVTLLGSPLFSALAEKKKKRNLVVISLRGGMAGCLAGWLAGCLAVLLAGWLVGLVGWLVG